MRTSRWLLSDAMSDDQTTYLFVAWICNRREHSISFSLERWSLVFFTRPANHVELTALTEDSPMIATAVSSAPDPSKFRTGQNAATWFARRIKYQRINNRTVSVDVNGLKLKLTSSGIGSRVVAGEQGH